MSLRICTVTGCTRKHQARNLCTTHAAWLRKGKLKELLAQGYDPDRKFKHHLAKSKPITENKAQLALFHEACNHLMEDV
jgi:hypothetical protein